jgi:hypothetical protein
MISFTITLMMGWLVPKIAGAALCVFSLPKRIDPSSGGGSWGRSLQLLKSAAYRHDSDVGSQSADPIKFCFRNQERPVLRNFRYHPSALFSAAH